MPFLKRPPTLKPGMASDVEAQYSASQKLYLWNEFCSAKMAEDDDPAQHVSKMQALASQLGVVSDESLAMAILNSLPESYSSLKQGMVCQTGKLESKMVIRALLSGLKEYSAVIATAQAKRPHDESSLTSKVLNGLSRAIGRISLGSRGLSTSTETSPCHISNALQDSTSGSGTIGSTGHSTSNDLAASNSCNICADASLEDSPSESGSDTNSKESSSFTSSLSFSNDIEVVRCYTTMFHLATNLEFELKSSLLDLCETNVKRRFKVRERWWAECSGFVVGTWDSIKVDKATLEGILCLVPPSKKEQANELINEWASGDLHQFCFAMTCLKSYISKVSFYPYLFDDVIDADTIKELVDSLKLSSDINMADAAALKRKICEYVDHLGNVRKQRGHDILVVVAYSIDIFASDEEALDSLDEDSDEEALDSLDEELEREIATISNCVDSQEERSTEILACS